MKKWISLAALVLFSVSSFAQDLDATQCEALQALDLRGQVERSYLDQGKLVGQAVTERFEIVKHPYRWKSLNKIIARIRAEGASVITPVFQGSTMAVLGMKDPSILKACVLMVVSANSEDYPLPLFVKRVGATEVEGMAEGPDRTLRLRVVAQ